MQASAEQEILGMYLVLGGGGVGAPDVEVDVLRKLVGFGRVEFEDVAVATAAIEQIPLLAAQPRLALFALLLLCVPLFLLFVLLFVTWSRRLLRRFCTGVSRHMPAELVDRS